MTASAFNEELRFGENDGQSKLPEKKEELGSNTSDSPAPCYNKNNLRPPRDI